MSRFLTAILLLIAFLCLTGCWPSTAESRQQDLRSRMVSLDDGQTHWAKGYHNAVPDDSKSASWLPWRW